MQILENISLKSYNTFSIDVKAKYFATFSSVEELMQLMSLAPGIAQQQPAIILGGGSNILFTQDYEGLVIRNEIIGMEIIADNTEHIYIKVGAGENWHQFVLYCLENNYAGIENLSLIPGNVGAGPMQNIGAYGVEIKDVFHELEAYHLEEKKVIKYALEDCEFGYRDSIFKRKLKNKAVITSVTFRLNKMPTFNTSYGAIQQELDQMGVTQLTINAISQAVINIRSSKLPDPAKIGNAGSFFKNPELSTEQFETLKQSHPQVPGYETGNGKVKVAAGWLIEQCGWKGYRKGDAGCHAKQALVLVNYGAANGIDIYNLSVEIMNSVEQKFGILLEREVNIV